MSQPKWTPGPWGVEKLGRITPWTDALSIAADKDGLRIHVAHTTRGFEGAQLPSGEHDETSCAWANAHLIAAAPEMFDALAAFVRQMDAFGPNSDPGRALGRLLPQARAALDKARGEPVRTAQDIAMGPRENPLHPMFRDHNCGTCHDGARPCVQGDPRNCGNPHARND